MMEIKPLQPQHINAAKRVMAEVCNEIWKLKPTVEELEQAFNEAGEFADLDNVQAAYFASGGIFLVLADNERIVGTGGIKHLDEGICELKRMWILRDYRAQGWGVKIALELLQFARQRGYRKVCLEVYDPPMQQRAIAFYQSLGFSEIPLYRNSPAQLAMEMNL